MTTPDDDIDPKAARSVAEFAACLRRLRARADNISYRALERWGHKHQRPLPRSTVLDALTGKRLPSKKLMLAFIQACGVDPRTDTRWVNAWNRLAEGRTTPGSTTDKTMQDPAAEAAGLAEVLAELSKVASSGPATPSALTRALVEAERLLTEAADLRRAAEQQATQLRAAAQRDVEALHAEAERERHRHRLSAVLADDVEAAGLRRIGARYLSELEWRDLFTGVRQLDIFVAYGQTWRNLHAHELSQVAARKNSRIRVFLADADDESTICVLARRFAITTDELRARIDTTRRDYAALRRPDGADIEIRYWPGDRVFSFYRFDDLAVVGFYSHTRTRTTSVPVFVCSAPGELYDFIRDELRTIEGESRLL